MQEQVNTRAGRQHHSHYGVYGGEWVVFRQPGDQDNAGLADQHETKRKKEQGPFHPAPI